MEIFEEQEEKLFIWYMVLSSIWKEAEKSSHFTWGWEKFFPVCKGEENPTDCV